MDFGSEVTSEPLNSSAMPKKVSAGVLLYRSREGRLEVLLAHPGGPFFAKKDRGHWTIPKGEPEEGESPQDTARRELKEELGKEPEGELIDLGEIRQKGGKIVYGWASPGDYDTTAPPPSNSFQLEWPPKSGQTRSFPEIDRVAFFDVPEALERINPAQRPFIERLQDTLDSLSRQI